MATNLLYKDIDLSLTPHPDTGDLVTLTDKDSVKRSVKTLLLTDFYERVMHPEKGSQVNGLLFEQDSPQVRSALKSAIKLVLERYEPRITVKRVRVNVKGGAYAVVVWFAIIDYNEVESVEILLTRVR